MAEHQLSDYKISLSTYHFTNVPDYFTFSLPVRAFCAGNPAFQQQQVGSVHTAPNRAPFCFSDAVRHPLVLSLRFFL